jgi:hypothetical protein
MSTHKDKLWFDRSTALPNYDPEDIPIPPGFPPDYTPGGYTWRGNPPWTPPTRPTLFAGGVWFVGPGRPLLYARIDTPSVLAQQGGIATYPISNPYLWKEVSPDPIYQDGGVAQVTPPFYYVDPALGGRTGTGTIHPAYEANANEQVQVGTIVLLYPTWYDQANQSQEYVFFHNPDDGFYAKIDSGTNPYYWDEVKSNGQGVWSTFTGGRSGTATVDPAYETNDNTTVPQGAIVWMRPRITTQEGQEYTFEYSVPGITVEDDDSNPTYSNIRTIQFDQADGFRVSNPSTGVAKLDFVNSVNNVGSFWAGSLSNSTAETSIIVVATGFSANSLGPYYNWRFQLWGWLSTTGTPTLRIKTKIGALTLVDTGAVTFVNANLSNRMWRIDVCAQLTTGGNAAARELWSQGFFTVMDATTGTATPTVWEMKNTAVQTLDTTVLNLVDCTAQWGTASPSNVLNVSHGYWDRGILPSLAVGV